MKKKEKELVISFLENLYERMSHCGCNDYSLPKSWTKAQAKSFVKEYLKYNNSLDDLDDFDKEDLKSDDFWHTYLPDFCVVDILADKLKKEC